MNRRRRAVPWALAAVIAAACQPGETRYSIDGVPRGHGPRSHGRASGRWTLLDMAGRRQTVGAFIEDVPVGTWKQFFGDGSLRERADLDHGVRHGPAATWRADGSRESQGRYERGLRTGPWTVWSVDGTVDAQLTGWYDADVRRPDVR